MTAPRWRIASDGTPSGTTVHLGDVDVSASVAAVAFRVQSDGDTDVRVEVLGSDVDLAVSVDELATLAVDAPAPAEPSWWAPEPIECPPNRYLFGSDGHSIAPTLPLGRMSPREAAEAAAWLSVIAESVDPSVDFDALRAAVRSS